MEGKSNACKAHNLTVLPGKQTNKTNIKKHPLKFEFHLRMIFSTLSSGHDNKSIWLLVASTVSKVALLYFYKRYAVYTSISFRLTNRHILVLLNLLLNLITLSISIVNCFRGVKYRLLITGRVDYNIQMHYCVQGRIHLCNLTASRLKVIIVCCSFTISLHLN